MKQLACPGPPMRSGSVYVLVIFGALELRVAALRAQQRPILQYVRSICPKSGYSMASAIEDITSSSNLPVKPKWRGHLHRNGAVVFPAIGWYLCRSAAAVSPRELRHVLMFWCAAPAQVLPPSPQPALTLFFVAQRRR